MTATLQRIALLWLMLISISGSLLAQRNPRATSKVDLAGKFVMVEYGRPSLKGRDILALVEPGKVWRMGADKSTTLTADGKLSFGKVTIPDGAYSLWLRKVSDKSFDLVFNKKTGEWGTQHEAIDDLASVPLSYSEGSESVEVFTVTLNKGSKGNTGEIELKWGKSVLKAAFTVK